jgi:hypothetical protein
MFRVYAGSNVLSLIGVEERKRAVGPLDLDGRTLSVAAIGEIAQQQTELMFWTGAAAEAGFDSLVFTGEDRLADIVDPRALPPEAIAVSLQVSANRVERRPVGKDQL